MSNHVWSIEELCGLLPETASAAKRIDKGLILKGKTGELVQILPSEKCRMLLKDGRRCPYRGKYNGLCGHHRPRVDSIKSKLIAAGAAISGATILVKFIESTLEVYHKLHPVLDMLMKHGVTEPPDHIKMARLFALHHVLERLVALRVIAPLPQYRDDVAKELIALLPDIEREGFLPEDF